MRKLWGCNSNSEEVSRGKQMSVILTGDEPEESLLGVRLGYLVRDSMALLDDLKKASKGAEGEIDELASMQQFISARLIQLRDKERA